MHRQNKITTMSFLIKLLLFFGLNSTIHTYTMDKGYSNLFTGPCTLERIQKISYDENDKYRTYSGILPDSILKATYDTENGRIEVTRIPFYYGMTMNAFTYEDNSWYGILKSNYKEVKFLYPIYYLK